MWLLSAAPGVRMPFIGPCVHEQEESPALKITAQMPLESPESGIIFVILFVVLVVPLIAWLRYRK
ncbi:hypothetical protein [Streptomyces sp. NPDC059611]|uniref:hypothetical protein n=1 Tax=Streptomyces sp. NPDC059611 TaxID=3346884 RepID=UPI0036B7DB3E